MTDISRVRTQAERHTDDHTWRQTAASRPGYATYPDTAAGSPCWWARDGDQPPTKPTSASIPWTGPDPMISGRIGPTPADVMAALNRAQERLAELPPPITCLRVHPIVRQLLARLADRPDSGRIPGPLDGFLGLPVIEDADLPYGEWRLIDADGYVVKQGNAARLGTGEQPPATPVVPPRRRWWHRYTRPARKD